LGSLLEIRIKGR